MHTATTSSSAPMSRAVIVHGYAADPTRHWFPWLTDQLTTTGAEVTCVALPDPAAQDAATWQQAIARGEPSAGASGTYGGTPVKEPSLPMSKVFSDTTPSARRMAAKSHQAQQPQLMKA